MTAVSGDLSDGELRPLPVLPGRMHLVQSRFVTLKNRDRKTLRFADLAAQATKPDPTLRNEQMVVTVDAQLFYTVLKALPYLVNYPYECTEQTLNRFVSTGIVSSLYGAYPAIAKMAAEFSKRETPLETFDGGRPEPEDGARGDAVAPGGERGAGRRPRPDERPRPADRGREPRRLAR